MLIGLFFREGQTFGMRFVGTQIVMKNGFKASMITVVLRQIFYSYLGMMTFIVPPILLFAINGLLLKFHPYKRLLHDFIAGTMVIQKY
ncbi:RDD family protein [Photobacterium leiognathi]|uniref:RDD family protein n=1 Tax=Photobacterium leiognathi TaxID=553611 RepID=UPI0006978399